MKVNSDRRKWKEFYILRKRVNVRMGGERSLSSRHVARHIILAQAQAPVLEGDSVYFLGETNREKIIGPCPSTAEGRLCGPESKTGAVGIIGPTSVHDRLTYVFDVLDEKFIDTVTIYTVREGSRIKLSQHASFSVKVCTDPDYEDQCCHIDSVMLDCEGRLELDCKKLFASEFRKEELKNKNNCKVTKGENFVVLEPLTTGRGPSHMAFIQDIELRITNETLEDIAQGSTTPVPAETVWELMMQNQIILVIVVLLVLLTAAAVYYSMDALVSIRECAVCGNTTEAPEQCFACGRWMCPDCTLEQEGSKYCSECGEQTFGTEKLDYEY